MFYYKRKSTCNSPKDTFILTFPVIHCSSLFTLHTADFSVFILIYVDDIIITRTNSTEIN